VSQEAEGEEEMTERKDRTEGTRRESSQEGDGRESLGMKSSPSRTLGKDLREAREEMWLVKDSQVGKCSLGNLISQGKEYSWKRRRNELSRERDNRVSAAERGARTELSDIVERRIDGTVNLADNPAV
jgi:hypothetical protein